MSKVATIPDFIARSGAGASSLKAYEYQLGQVERWLGKPLVKATERDLIDLKKKLREMASGPHYTHLLRMFYKEAGREDLRELCVLKQRLKKLAPDAILSVKEVQALIESASSLRDRALIACLWETGGRIHELLALDLKDVREKPEDGGPRGFVLWFRKTKVAGEEHRGYILEAPRVLEAWLKAHPDRRGDAPLFPSFTGGRLDRRGGWVVIKKAARKAGVEKRVYPHLFRHSRATHLLRIGVPEGQVKKLLGWSPATTMLTRYSHLIDRDAYLALLKAEGYDVPKEVEVGGLDFAEDALKPVAPMAAPAPGLRMVPGNELEELLRDPNVVRFLALLQAAKGV